jgi:beta-mannosidase
VLWCGNNENELGLADGWIAGRDPTARPDRALSFDLLPRVIAAEDGSRPYWPTSPWSPDGSHPNAQHTGDQHPWRVGLGSAKGDYWQYRDDASRFPNEGGVLGPSTPATLRHILPPEERRVGSRTWLHHDNTQNTWRGEPMIDNMLRLNLCETPRDLPFDDYVRYAGLLHGEALETAIDNWRRRKFDSASAVFWMFNDTWPACTSWTPIDYYRRRKPAFWFVKRAFANLRAVCVELDEEWGVFVVNDYLEPRDVRVRYGLFALAGARPIDETRDLTCPANAAVLAARLPLSDWDAAGVETHGAFAVLSDPSGRDRSTHRLFRARFKDLKWPVAAVQCERTEAGLRLRSDTFAWSVCLDDTGEHALPMNYVDLIPGVERVIPWPTSLPPPTPVVANPTRKVLFP